MSGFVTPHGMNNIYFLIYRQLVKNPVRENLNKTPGKNILRVSPSSKEKLIQRGYWLLHQMKVNRFYRG
jgi:putative ABC transport system permease protein